MKFIRLWLIAILLCGPAVAHAAHCRAVVVKKNVVVVEKVVAAAVVVPVVAQFVTVPLYSAAYVPAAPIIAPAPVVAPVVAPVQKDCHQQSAETFRQIGDLLKQLDSRLQRLEGGKPGVPPMAPADPPGKPTDPFNPGTEPQVNQGNDKLLALATRHCASCHDASRSAASGKGFTLLQGGKFSTALTPESVGKIIAEVTSGRMPKGGQMTAQERLEFVALLVEGK